MKDKNLVIRIDEFTKDLIRDVCLYKDVSISNFVLDCVKKEVKNIMLDSDYLDFIINYYKEK